MIRHYMAGNGRIIIEPTKPAQKRGEETLSMKVARYLDPILRKPEPAPPLMEGANNGGKQDAGSEREESVSDVVERHIGRILRNSQPPPAATRNSSNPPAPFGETSGISSYPTMKPFEDKPAVEDVIEAINKYDLKKVKDLHRRGAPLDVPDAKGWTPMATAIMNRCEDIAEYILSEGIDHSRKTGDWSYLMLAAVSNALTIGERLMQSGKYSKQETQKAIAAANENGYHIFARMAESHL
jgi:hypothetical protein